MVTIAHLNFNLCCHKVNQYMNKKDYSVPHIIQYCSKTHYSIHTSQDSQNVDQPKIYVYSQWDSSRDMGSNQG